jgi:hypothetical protein
MAPTPKPLADSLLKAPPPRANGARPQNPSKAEPIVEAQLIAERLGHLDEADPIVEAQLIAERLGHLDEAELR